MTIIISKKHLAIGLVLVIALIAVQGVSAADNGIIYACVNTRGMPRIVEEGETCLPQETALEWNVQGLKGDPGEPGPPGPTGPEGPQGDPGEPGVLGFYIKWENITVEPQNPIGDWILCDEGDIATGGGFANVTPGLYLHTSRPHTPMWPHPPYASPVGWYVTVWNPTNEAKNAVLEVVCADMP